MKKTNGTHFLTGAYGWVIFAAFLLPQFAMAEGNNPYGFNSQGQGFQPDQFRFERNRIYNQGLKLGVCAGQILAQQGQTIPMPQAGQPSSIDQSGLAAIRSAIASCKAQMYSGNTNATPTHTNSGVSTGTNTDVNTNSTGATNASGNLVPEVAAVTTTGTADSTAVSANENDFVNVRR